MPYLIVEYDFNPPLTEEALERAAKTLAPCLEVRNIKKLRSVISADRLRGYCEFEAPDAETLREAYRSARIAFRSVWPAQIYDYQPPSGG
jgi:hypothetical protein